MSSDIHSLVQAVLPGVRQDLEDLVRIPSVSADPERLHEVERSAEKTAELLAAEGVDVEKNEMDTSAFKNMVKRVVKDFPNVKVVGTTLRGVKTALINDWSAILYTEGQFYDGPEFKDLEIEDRVGGGDGFASGFAYGFLAGKSPQECVNLGVAHGALLMSTRGDTSQITLEELLHTAAGGSARIKR